MRLLIISDVHYPVGSIAEVRQMIKKVKPDNLAFLGDNIDTRNGDDAVVLYRKFVAQVSGIFPMSRTILMLGDGDYLFQDKRRKVLQYANSLKTMNRNHLVYRKGNMLFSHGNIERSRHLEKIGKGMVLLSVSRGAYGPVPFLVGILARTLLKARPSDYLFLGHLHFLGKSITSRTTFCGTLNRTAEFFGRRSLGYVVVEHEDFIVNSMDDIKTVSIGR